MWMLGVGGELADVPLRNTQTGIYSVYSACLVSVFLELWRIRGLCSVISPSVTLKQRLKTHNSTVSTVFLHLLRAAGSILKGKYREEKKPQTTPTEPAISFSPISPLSRARHSETCCLVCRNRTIARFVCFRVVCVCVSVCSYLSGLWWFSCDWNSQSS